MRQYFDQSGHDSTTIKALKVLFYRREHGEKRAPQRILESTFLV
jgi:hypothetical protein